MEDGGVDRTIIDCRQHQLGQMADLLTFLAFGFLDHAAHTDECGPIIKSEHLWVCTKFMHLHIPISLIVAMNRFAKRVLEHKCYYYTALNLSCRYVL